MDRDRPKPVVEVPSDSHFPLENLPYGVFSFALPSSAPSSNNQPQPGTDRHLGTRLGDHVISITDLLRDNDVGSRLACPTNSLDLLTQVFCDHRDTLNNFMALGRPHWTALRAKLTTLLTAPLSFKDSHLHHVDCVVMHLPADIGDYTDFYSSKEHATNIGSMFRDPDNALLPNWTHMPVAYHGRASSVVLSGTDVRRPMGQTRAEGQQAPAFTPSKLVDFELEVAFFFGGPENELGEALSLQQARDRIFGLVLMNDWSARDIQKWEYVPLGPFGAKNFATSISPWVVTLDALEPFATEPPSQADVPTLPYLTEPHDFRRTFDLPLQVSLCLADDQGQESDAQNHLVCSSNFKHLYWTMEQQLAHHTVTGCNMRPGDLLASGTISGKQPESFGSMIELSWKGLKPLILGDKQRKFLQDGDTVKITGACTANGYTVGFGECVGRVLPSRG